MKRRQIWCVLLVLLIFAACTKRSGEPVALVNGEEIYVREFQERYSTYLSATGVRDNIVQRKLVLDNMINERLILAEVRRKGWDRDEDSRRQLEEIRTQALLNGFTRRVVLDTMMVSEQELYAEFRASNSKVKARYVYGRTLAEARELKRRLTEGATFEELAKEVFDDPGLANNGGSVGYFGWGEMDAAFEQAAFALPIGGISEPVKTGVGYAIIKVDDRVEIPLASQFDFEKRRAALTRQILERKTPMVLTASARSTAAAFNPEFVEETLQRVLEVWDRPSASATGQEVGESSKLKETERNLVLVRFQSDTWTIRRFFEKARMTSERQRSRVKDMESLKEFIIGLKVREEFVRRALELEIDRDSTVRAELEKASLLYYLRRWSKSVEESAVNAGVDEKELRAHFEQHRQLYAHPVLINVAEILVRTAREAEAMHAQVLAGADFSELARRHSIRTWAAKQGGELGFGTISSYSIMGERFARAQVGEIVGPVRVDPYYAVFKILARKESRQKTFEEARPDIEAELLRKKRSEYASRTLQQLRAGASVHVREDVLAHVEVQQ